MTAVTRSDIDNIILGVEELIGADEANALRAYLDLLEGRLRVYQFGDDDNLVEEVEE